MSPERRSVCGGAGIVALRMRIRNDGLLDRLVRHLGSEWGWPGVVFLGGGLLAFVIGPSIEWLDYRGVPDDLEQAVALGVAAFGFVWILAAAGYYRLRPSRRRPRTRRQQ
jgi:hypothetical protein